MSTVVGSPHEVGIAPVGREGRVLGFRDTFVLWSDLGVSFLVMVVGMFLVPGLSLVQAFLAILLGALIGNLLLGLAAAIGSDVGVPTMALLRPSLGMRGSYLPSVINVVQLVGWATFEVIVMAQAADALLQRLIGVAGTYPAWALLFAVLTTLLAVWGPVQVVKKFLERYVFWLVLATTIWLTAAIVTSYDVGELLARKGTGEMPFLAAVDLVVALPISWFPLVADYSRLSRNRTAAFWGTGLGYFVPHVWFYMLGALLVMGAGVAFDPVAPVAPLIAAIAGLTFGWAALLILLVDETDEGFANVYSAAISVRNVAPGMRQRDVTLAIGAVVLVLAQIVPLTEYESFLLLVGSFFVPLLGVLAADYYLIRGGRYDGGALFSTSGPYWYASGFHWNGLLCWAVGAATYIAIAGIGPLGVAGVAPWLGATVPSLVVSFLLYALLGQLGFARESRR
jgi:nucleobase:cation symporter-1, NCS1 family